MMFALLDFTSTLSEGSSSYLSYFYSGMAKIGTMWLFIASFFIGLC
jgi:hypothetical protein